MPSAHVPEYSSVGLKFATALAGRDYSTAYAMTSSDYQRNTTLDEMRTAFEAIVPTDWSTEADTLKVRSVEFGRP